MQKKSLQSALFNYYFLLFSNFLQLIIMQLIYAVNHLQLCKHNYSALRKIIFIKAWMQSTHFECSCLFEHFCSRSVIFFDFNTLHSMGSPWGENKYLKWETLKIVSVLFSDIHGQWFTRLFPLRSNAKFQSENAALNCYVSSF